MGGSLFTQDAGNIGHRSFLFSSDGDSATCSFVRPSPQEFTPIEERTNEEDDEEEEKNE